jgi:hypothetical protein
MRHRSVASHGAAKSSGIAETGDCKGCTVDTTVRNVAMSRALGVNGFQQKDAVGEINDQFIADLRSAEHSGTPARRQCSTCCGWRPGEQ